MRAYVPTLMNFLVFVFGSSSADDKSFHFVGHFKGGRPLILKKLFNSFVTVVTSAPAGAEGERIIAHPTSSP